jgi:3-isopropylmalate/(R)-2-methylmalate dehydratase small subunit
MSQIHAISGRAVPLTGNDIDTDRIIPARFLRCITFDGLGAQVFADDRAQMDGQHSFDQLQYQGAEILVVNRNFGCGSSREHAPQAIAKWGIKAIVGESFAEIFFGNCVSLGIPCVTAATAEVQSLQQWIAAHPEASITLNLETMQVQTGSTPDLALTTTMPESARNMFLSGSWDACGQLVAQTIQIRQTAERLPYVSWSQAK